MPNHKWSGWPGAWRHSNWRNDTEKLTDLGGVYISKYLVIAFDYKEREENRSYPHCLVVSTHRELYVDMSMEIDAGGFLLQQSVPQYHLGNYHSTELDIISSVTAN